MILPSQIWHDFLSDLISFPANCYNNMPARFKRCITLIKKRKLKSGLKSSTESVEKYKGDKIRNKPLFCTHIHIYKYSKPIPS